MNARLKRFAIFLHRWMGVTFCVLFAWWFVSGIFMLYWDYPSVRTADRLVRAPNLSASRIQLDAREAYAKLEIPEAPSQIRLGMYDRRPAYRFRMGQEESLVFADNGEVRTEFPLDLTLRIAADWADQPENAARVQVNTEEDQWTVAGQFRALRPLMKYSWADGQQVYVSTVTGEVVQYTTRADRIFAHLGPIPHWLYYTPLRKNGQRWSQAVIWLSGFATLAALLGLLVGIWMYSPSKRYSMQGAPTSIPYTGQKRLHTIAGLFFGIVACTWAFSGMLSLDPFPLPQPAEEVGARIASALRGRRLSPTAFALKSPREALTQLERNFPVKELDLVSIAGEPFYLATGMGGQIRIVPLQGEPMEELDRNVLLGAIRRAARPFQPVEVRVVTKYEAYYIDRQERRPLPVLFARLNDRDSSMYYVDLKTGRVVGTYDSLGRWNRWLYHGLHSLDLPWLYAHRPAWDILILVLMLGGVALSVTSVILGWRVVKRKMRRRVPRAHKQSLLVEP